MPDVGTVVEICANFVIAQGAELGAGSCSGQGYASFTAAPRPPSSQRARFYCTNNYLRMYIHL